IRTNDIENVGRTRRHHTFFEMLGNFSFGDYFKEEAITWAWEFLTERVKLQKNRMYISIYKKDDEAFKIWNGKIKIPAERIFRMGEATNFWEMGEVGPCGYCSEIYFDLEGGEKGVVTLDDLEKNDDRFLEVWNLVFTEFDKQADGSLKPLKQKNIDTGMGLERLAAVSQGVYSNFETDLFMPIIKDAAEKAGTSYGKNEKTDISLRVIADHARSVTFLVADGVLPSNEGRGYVLRRVIRRAVRHGRLLGIKEPFLFKVVPVVTLIMKEAYPEISDRKEYITQIIKMEEDKFQETMDKGMAMLEHDINALKSAGKNRMEGAAAFKLYDTYGFPLEITEEILAENGITADRQGFIELMEKQREMAKKAWKGTSSELAEKMP
ncbi:MAG TPA: alanine--tRNA ligase, partial [Candidatus Goldiibacteriota bacterium]|nr:alanine--tRNA ligase [Candidatus Goldiibacteriota bacterium]